MADETKKVPRFDGVDRPLPSDTLEAEAAEHAAEQKALAEETDAGTADVGAESADVAARKGERAVDRALTRLPPG